MGKRGFLVAAIGLAALLAPAAARADTLTMGKMAPAGYSPGNSGTTADFQLAGGGGAVEAVPPGTWTLTEWRSREGATVAATNCALALDVWRPTGAAGEYQLLSRTTENVLGETEGIAAFPANISLQPGDHIGLLLVSANPEVLPGCESNDYAIHTPTMDSADLMGEPDGDTSPGTVVVPDGTPPKVDLNTYNGVSVNLEATLTGTPPPPITPGPISKPKPKKCKKKAKKRSASVAKKKKCKKHTKK